MIRGNTPRPLIWVATLALLAAGLSAGAADEPTATANATDLSGLDLGSDWINVGGPIHARDLRGKVVVLDFWTLCCINCHHILPDLARLEEKYKDQLVVIGVHTPKFPAERDTEIVRAKVNEYRIKHPVVSDADEVIWKRYGVRSWPTLLVFDARGQLVQKLEGEIGGRRESLERLLRRLIGQGRAEGVLDPTPLRFAPESEKSRRGPLHYPGKIASDAASRRLFISDTGNNRVVVTDLEGKAAEAIGSGASGLTDGGFATAMFNRPQGLCLHDGVLYVADTENHAIRAVDFQTRKVRTVAGFGVQGPPRMGFLAGAVATTPLNSPWDVLVPSGSQDLYIAMAGYHQIWKLALGRGTVGPWAGTGEENIRDGHREQARFAQPSGLASDGHHLFVADSETSSIRSLPLRPAGAEVQVETLAGSGLFVFGDVDGGKREARLQHDLGLTFGDGKLFVADTYNNKVKQWSPETHEIRALVGSEKAEAGSGDQPPRFNQPGGLALVGTNLYVADTNNHEIRVVDLATTPPAVRTLEIEGLAPPQTPKLAPKFPNPTSLATPPAQAAPGANLKLDVRLVLPPGFKLNPEAPLTYLVEMPGSAKALKEPLVGTINPPSTTFEINVPLASPTVSGETLTVKLWLATFQCRTGSEGLCLVKSYVWTVPVAFAAQGPQKVSLTQAPAVAN